MGARCNAGLGQTGTCAQQTRERPFGPPPFLLLLRSAQF